jgi:hypothetical protein
MLRLAVVATTVPDRRLLERWIDHHLGLGFARCYLFLDGEGDAAAALASSLEQRAPGRVSARLVDAELAREWASLDPSLDVSALAGRVFMRQMLNVPLAVRAALHDGMDWLLHLDLDELFYPETGRLEDAFAAEPGIEQLVFLNDEVLPTELRPTFAFEDHRWFKRNPNLVSHWLIHTALAASRRPFYFLGYANGKAAVRVTAERGERLPEGVHGHDASEVPTALGAQGTVLHYAFASFDLFFDRFFRSTRLHDAHGTDEFRDSFYGWATRTFEQAAREGLDRAWLERRFAEVVVLDDAARRDQLAETGLVRCLEPWRLVGDPRLR